MIKFLRPNKPAKASLETYFLSKHYQMHNVARLSHLESLGLPLKSRSVIEFGAGIGDHTFYYLTKGCRMVTTDVRSELVEFIKKRFDVEAFIINAEKDIDKIRKFEKCDIVHCYGLLYHIQNPMEFLRSLNDKCDLLLLETCVSHDLREDGAYIVSEDVENPTQAVSGNGCRPTRKWIYDILKQNFPFVYFPKTQPDHPEFPP
jgi:2-polyprenyl-3-methyl-5-hydroxy-6-metoxy-1,4-benzoquinol methylase